MEEKVIVVKRKNEHKKKIKGASHQHKQKLHLKKITRREKSVKSCGTAALSQLGHVKKEMSEREKAFFGRK